MTGISGVPRKLPAVVKQSMAVKSVVSGITAENVRKERGVNVTISHRQISRWNTIHRIGNRHVGDFGTLGPISPVATKLVNSSLSTSSLTSRVVSCFQRRSTKRRRSRSGRWRSRRRESACVWLLSTLQVGAGENEQQATSGDKRVGKTDAEKTPESLLH